MTKKIAWFPKEDIYPTVVNDKGYRWSNWSEEVTVKCDKVIDNTRWAIVHEVVFEYKGKCYQTIYYVGATEYQSEEPFEFEDEIECYEVELKEVSEYKWVPIEED